MDIIKQGGQEIILPRRKKEPRREEKAFLKSINLQKLYKIIYFI